MKRKSITRSRTCGRLPRRKSKRKSARRGSILGSNLPAAFQLIVVPLLCFIVWPYQESGSRAGRQCRGAKRASSANEGNLRRAAPPGTSCFHGRDHCGISGSTVLWKYKDGTTVRILGDIQTGDQCRCKLAKQVRLERGELVASVAKRYAERWSSRLRALTATVVGTELRLVVAETNTQLDVTEGKVDFQRNSSGQILRIAANESGIATAANIQENKVLWPVNRASAAFLYEGEARLPAGPDRHAAAPGPHLGRRGPGAWRHRGDVPAARHRPAGPLRREQHDRQAGPAGGHQP